jgi:hypothetical protein
MDEFCCSHGTLLPCLLWEAGTPATKRRSYIPSSVIRPSAIRHPSFVIRHSSFVIRHSSSVIRHPSSVIRHPSFVTRHSSFAVR